MQKFQGEKEKIKSMFEIAEDIFNDEFFSPSLPLTNITRRSNRQIEKIKVDEEFDTSESHLNKDFEPFFKNNNNQNFSNNYYSSHSYYTSSNQEGQEEPKIESFEKSVFTHSNKEGKKIGESKSKYENTYKGIKKEAHEKKIDDKTYKIIKENKLNSNEEVEHKVYKGISGEDVNDFENEFEKYRVNFGVNQILESAEKTMKKEKKHKQIKG
jgi:hypothetical protein